MNLKHYLSLIRLLKKEGISNFMEEQIEKILKDEVIPKLKKESDERLAQDFKELAECMRAKHEGIADDFQRISDNLNEGVKGKP
jgi:trans-2-enoyl-CoA reductase